MPQVVHEFTRDELALALGESRGRAEALLTAAWHLAARLGATLAALRDGTITRPKAELIVWATQHLDDDEARAAEALVLGRAGRGHGRAARPRLPRPAPSGRRYHTEPTRYPSRTLGLLVQIDARTARADRSRAIGCLNR
jgi:hypothetical protein